MLLVDVSEASDGRRLDLREKLLELLAEVEADQAAGRSFALETVKLAGHATVLSALAPWWMTWGYATPTPEQIPPSMSP